MMIYIGNNTSEYRELLNNFDAMEPDRQTKAVVILFAMGNRLDTLLKLNAEGLETDDNLSMSWMRLLATSAHQEVIHFGRRCRRSTCTEMMS